MNRCLGRECLQFTFSLLFDWCFPYGPEKKARIIMDEPFCSLDYSHREYHATFRNCVKIMSNIKWTHVLWHEFILYYLFYSASLCLSRSHRGKLSLLQHFDSYCTVLLVIHHQPLKCFIVKNDISVLIFCLLLVNVREVHMPAGGTWRWVEKM